MSVSLAVRPPEYFPRLPYAALMLAVDRFVVADTVQYSRQSFQNRARLRTPEGRQWISVPLKGGQHGRPIRAVEIRAHLPWIGKHRRAFEFNYRTTPYFEHYEADLLACFDPPPVRLAPLTGGTVRLLHRLLGATCTLDFVSSWPDPPDTLAGIVARLGAERLLALPESAAHEAATGAAVDVLRFECRPYRQNFAGFEPGCSAFDLFFNYGPETARMIRERTTVG